mgnify:CR=1 FL=1
MFSKAALDQAAQCLDGVGFIGPADVEKCDAVDNDCEGTVDVGAICPTHFTCLAGVCVPDACGVEIPPPEGYACNAPPSQGGTGDTDGTLVLGACGADLDGCAAGVVVARAARSWARASR